MRTFTRFRATACTSMCWKRLTLFVQANALQISTLAANTVGARFLFASTSNDPKRADSIARRLTRSEFFLE